MSAAATLPREALASVLDRLLDDRPDQVQEHPPSAGETLARLRASVHRDLEALLNARRPWQSVPAKWPLLRTSPLGFGIRDYAAGACNDAGEREELRADVEQTIRRFEPRLLHVEVTLTEDASPLRATMVLRIDAILSVQPQPQPISFDTLVDTTTADVTLRPVQS